MKIPSIQAYRDTIINNDDTVQSSKDVNRIQVSIDDDQSNRNLYNPKNIITRKERDFFIGLFPENSEQLERHILFNSQGRLQTQNVTKGMIIDGTA